jgi:hypothetical protein
LGKESVGKRLLCGMKDLVQYHSHDAMLAHEAIRSACGTSLVYHEYFKMNNTDIRWIITFPYHKSMDTADTIGVTPPLSADDTIGISSNRFERVKG